MNILIIKPSSLGDVVQALPVLKILRQKYPHATIDWLVNEEVADILRDNPYLHTIHRWDRAIWRRPRCFLKALRNAASVVRELRRSRYDVVFDLQGLFRSAVLAFLSGGETVIGFANAREKAPLFYRKKVELPTKEMHSVERYIFAVGGDVSAEKEFPIEFSAEDREITESLLARMDYSTNKPFAILVPGARWPTKRWPPKQFAALADRLVKGEGVQVGLIGAPGEAALIQRIASLSRCRTMDFSGKTALKQLAYLLKKADLVVGNDSGPIHIAAAVGTPVVALYGPTSPLRTGPYGENHTVLTSSLPCRPCFSRKCAVSVACMKTISVDSVFEACKPYLDEARRKKGAS